MLIGEAVWYRCCDTTIIPYLAACFDRISSPPGPSTHCVPATITAYRTTARTQTRRECTAAIFNRYQYCFTLQVTNTGNTGVPACSNAADRGLGGQFERSGYLMSSSSFDQLPYFTSIFTTNSLRSSLRHGFCSCLASLDRQWPHARRPPRRLVPMPRVCGGKRHNRCRPGWTCPSQQGKSALLCCACYRDHDRLCFRSVSRQSPFWQRGHRESHTTPAPSQSLVLRIDDTPASSDLVFLCMQREVGMDFANMKATKVGVFTDPTVAKLLPMKQAIESLESNGIK